MWGSTYFTHTAKTGSWKQPKHVKTDGLADVQSFKDECFMRLMDLERELRHIGTDSEKN
jgi:hypothetical protein